MNQIWCEQSKGTQHTGDMTFNNKLKTSHGNFYGSHNHQTWREYISELHGTITTCHVIYP